MCWCSSFRRVVDVVVVSVVDVVVVSESIKISAETMAEAPVEFKCALTGGLLREAVSLPCCGKVL